MKSTWALEDEHTLSPLISVRAVARRSHPRRPALPEPDPNAEGSDKGAAGDLARLRGVPAAEARGVLLLRGVRAAQHLERPRESVEDPVRELSGVRTGGRGGLCGALRS